MKATIIKNSDTIKQRIKTLKQAKRDIIAMFEPLPKIEEKDFYMILHSINTYSLQLDEELQNKTFCKWCKNEIETDSYSNKFCSKLCKFDYYGE